MSTTQQGATRGILTRGGPIESANDALDGLADRNHVRAMLARLAPWERAKVRDVVGRAEMATARRGSYPSELELTRWAIRKLKRGQLL